MSVGLSKRLSCIADFVTDKQVVCDVGCDHGYLSIYLIQSQKSPFVYAMDVRKGPLESAKRNIDLYQVQESIELILSDGLINLPDVEVDTLVCAGMGGPLMEKILCDSWHKTKKFKKFILQPQSQLREFRKFLRENGFFIEQEKMLIEDGKFYTIIKAGWKKECQESVVKEESRLKNHNEQRVYDCFGEYLILEKNEILIEYLQKTEKQLNSVLIQVQENDEQRAKEIKEELEVVFDCFKMMNL